MVMRCSSSIRKEDAAYIKFVHDITEDVLARGIYSDRGLQQLFQRHVADNEGQLSLVSEGSRALLNNFIWCLIKH
jgi:hypothetical protein